MVHRLYTFARAAELGALGPPRRSAMLCSSTGYWQRVGRHQAFGSARTSVLSSARVVINMPAVSTRPSRPAAHGGTSSVVLVLRQALGSAIRPLVCPTVGSVVKGHAHRRRLALWSAKPGSHVPGTGALGADLAAATPAMMPAAVPRCSIQFRLCGQGRACHPSSPRHRVRSPRLALCPAWL